MRYALPSVIAVVCSVIAGVLIDGQSESQDAVKIPDPPAIIQGVTTNQKEYSIGDTVNITFAAQNRTNQPITYTFPTTKQFDVWIMRGPREVWRLSKHSSYTKVLTQLVIQPGETKTWTLKWDQLNDQGQGVSPCGYEIYGQLTPVKQNFLPAKTNIVVAPCEGIAILPITIDEGIRRFNVLQNQQVRIDGVYQGSRPDSTAANCRPGPPVTRSDWAVSDDSGCIYVTGGTLGLDLRDDIGKKVSVVGTLKKTDKGQVYLQFVSGVVK